MKNQHSAQEWFRKWFREEAYLERYAHRDLSEAKKVVHMILSRIPLEEKTIALDCACGNGRHVRYLKNEFRTVVGIDLSMPLLFNGKQFYSQLELLQADVRSLPFKNLSFQCIFSLFTSFGYFDDATNKKLLESWNKITQASGYLIIDTVNPLYIKNTLENKTIHHTENYKFIETKEIRNKRIEKFIELEPLTQHAEKNVSSTFSESVRLYEYNELQEILFEAGYSCESVLGNYEGEAFNPESSSHDRMICIAKKSI